MIDFVGQDSGKGWELTKFGVAEDLRPVLKEIEEYCEDKFAVFYGWLEAQSNVYWVRDIGGVDYKRFLQVAKKLDVKLIFITTNNVLSDETAAAMEHRGEIAFITLYFFYNQVKYVLYIDAKWYRSPPPKPLQKPDDKGSSSYR
jgi:hypothetical protein